jgi:hypothetical protein
VAVLAMGEALVRLEAEILRQHHHPKVTMVATTTQAKTMAVAVVVLAR